MTTGVEMSPTGKAGSELAVAKRQIISKGGHLSNQIRIKIQKAEPVDFLIAAMEGEPIGGDEAEDGSFPDGEVLSLDKRIDIAKFLTGKVVATLAPQQFEIDPGDSDHFKWTIALDEMNKTSDVDEGDVDGVDVRPTRARGKPIKRRKPHKIYDQEGE